MKTIKFRAWHNNKMLYEIQRQILQPIFDDNIPVMQFTGLKDKNGKEIYEGDICLDPKRKEGHKAVKIIWCDWMACYLISGKANWSENLHTNIEDLEIIGNIHQDKHLLK